MEEFDLELSTCPSEYYGQYIDLDEYKKVRLLAMCETTAMLIIEYSHNKVVADLTQEIKLSNGKWISLYCEPKMRYMRYHLKVPEEDKKITIKMTGTKIVKPIVSTGWFW